MMNQDEPPKPVILMVDDTPTNLHLLFDLLSEAGFEVLVAEDGESALARAHYTRPDLILLDDDIVRKVGANLQQACDVLVELTNARGGRDDSTVVALRYSP
jgi:CheY-like chemotaxis protein